MAMSNATVMDDTNKDPEKRSIRLAHRKRPKVNVSGNEKPAKLSVYALKPKTWKMN